jgi:hypothetical protein
MLCQMARGFRKKRLFFCVVLSTVGLLAVAGGALAENYQYRFTSADQMVAARIVLDPSNVPKGWTGGSVKPNLSPDPLRCPGYYAPRESDLVVTGAKETDFTYKNGQELDTYSTVFQSAAMVETDWRRSNNVPSFFKCLRAKWTTLPAGKGSKITSLALLSLPRFGTHSLAYRVVFKTSASRQRIAVDSVLIARGRYEVELDQIVQGPSSGDLANMTAGDRYIAHALDAKLLAAH